MMSSSKSRRIWRRTALALAASVGLIVGVGGGGTAQAAQLDGVVRDITVTPTNPRPFDLIRTTVDWCVPDDARGGDFFTITLPEQFRGLPPSFELRDRTGALAATGVIAGTPEVATITLTDYVNTRVGVCGDAFFSSRMDANQVAGSTQTLVYVVNGDQVFERTIEVAEIQGPDRSQAVKRSWFTRSNDQCRTETTDCIAFAMLSRPGPLDSVTFDDGASEGISFNCDALSIVVARIDESGQRVQDFTPAEVGATVTNDCSTSQLTVTIGAIPEAHLVVVRIPGTPDVPAAREGTQYLNSAAITHDAGNQVFTDNVTSSSRSAAAGGSAEGVGIDIEKYDIDTNDADTAAEAVELATGTTPLVFTITNTGTDALVDVEVTDDVLAGGATVDGLTCNFSMASVGAPTSGTTWAGPFDPGDQFDCTATLNGVAPGVPHVDEATVVGFGQVSGDRVVDRDQYHAFRRPGTPPPTTAPPTATTQPVVTTPTTSPPSPTMVTLPKTGSSPGTMTGLAVGLLAAGAVLAGLAVRRPGREG